MNKETINAIKSFPRSDEFETSFFTVTREDTTIIRGRSTSTKYVVLEVLCRCIAGTSETNGYIALAIGDHSPTLAEYRLAYDQAVASYDERMRAATGGASC